MAHICISAPFKSNIFVLQDDSDILRYEVATSILEGGSKKKLVQVEETKEKMAQATGEIERYL